MGASFALRILGPPALYGFGGAPVVFRTRKHLALLVYLHLEGRLRPLSRDHLVELLWPGVPVARGRHSLSQALVAIRQRVGPGALTYGGRDVQLLADLDTELSLDGVGVDRVPEVVEPLRGLEDCGAVEFAHWVERARARLVDQARDLLRARLKAARSRGDLAAVQAAAVRLYRLDPLCAEAVCALAERALLDGDGVGALRLLKEQVARARAELGGNPHPEIAELMRRLERGVRPSFLMREADWPAGVKRREVFVGRERELARLEGLWERVRKAGYETCVLVGPPGIGKSSLIRRYAISVASRAWPAFVVSCQEIGQGIPYAAIADLILAMAMDPEAGGTDPGWLAEASRVCPALRNVYPGIPQPPEAPTDSIRLRVAEAVLRMMDAVTEGGPILLAFDDVQHMDPASREVLFLVTRRMERLPVLILATSQPDGSEVFGLADRPHRAGLVWAHRIDVGPMEPEQAAQQVTGLWEKGQLDGRIQATIIRLAQGNPYLIELLVADWRQHEERSLVAAESSGGEGVVTSWDPPETLRVAFERQYRVFASEVRRVLQVLAVAARALPAAEVAGLLRWDRTRVEQAMLQVLDGGVGRMENGRLRFKNDLHRAYVYYAMGEEQRKYFHQRLGECLAEGLGEEDFQRMLEASHHFIGARMQRPACEFAIRGAELATRRGAPGEAERALTLLLRVYPQDGSSRVHLLLAEALVAEGKYREALEALGRWEEGSGRPEARALAAQLRAEALHRGRFADDRAIVEAANAAVNLARGAKADLTLIRALQVEAEVAAEAGDIAGAEAAGAQAEAVAAASGNPECQALARLTRGYCLMVDGQFETAAGVFAEVAEELRRLTLQVELRRVLNGLGMCYTASIRMADAIKPFAEALLVAEKLGDRVGSCTVWNNVAVVYHNAAHYNAARKCYEAALRLLPLTPRSAAALYSNVARMAMEFGDFDHATEYANLGVLEARRSQSWHLTVGALGTRADVHIAMGQSEAALPLIEHAMNLTGDRCYVLADPGQFARLRAQFLWLTKGYEHIKREPAKREGRTGLSRLSDWLEVRAFEEWIAYREKDFDASLNAANELVRLKLYGVVARLLALGVGFPSIGDVGTGESSAKAVERIFPETARLVIPEIDRLLPATYEPRDSA